MSRVIFTIDVEDWFHILDLPSTPPLSAWDGLESRVERNFHRLLAILGDADAKATCFFLGWIAERFPGLVRDAADAGHEIASHGFAHDLVYSMSRDEFAADVRKAKSVIEDALGGRVRGYRAPGFSVTEATPWFFETLAETGHAYSSSVFPAPRGHGGMRTDRLGPHVRDDAPGGFVEAPITVTKALGTNQCLFGGGYLRLFPYPVIRRGARAVLAEGRPVIVYIHPREIDPDHPRLPMGRVRRFKSYVNLGTTEAKLRRILSDFPNATLAEHLGDQTHVESA